MMGREIIYFSNIILLTHNPLIIFLIMRKVGVSTQQFGILMCRKDEGELASWHSSKKKGDQLILRVANEDLYLSVLDS